MFLRPSLSLRLAQNGTLAKLASLPALNAVWPDHNDPLNRTRLRVENSSMKVLPAWSPLPPFCSPHNFIILTVDPPLSREVESSSRSMIPAKREPCVHTPFCAMRSTCTMTIQETAPVDTCHGAALCRERHRGLQRIIVGQSRERGSSSQWSWPSRLPVKA